MSSIAAWDDTVCGLARPGFVAHGRPEVPTHPSLSPSGWVREVRLPWDLPEARPETEDLDRRRASAISAPAPAEPHHLLAGSCLIALRSVNRAFASVASRSGEILLLLQRQRAHEVSGFASFADFAREILQLAPRTARRRVALARTAALSPPLHAAFLDGRLSLCKLLALRRLGASPELPFWIELAETISVRQCIERLRAEGNEDSDLDPPEDPAPVRVEFAAPVSATLVWEHGLSAARRVLGWNAPVHVCVDAVLAESGEESVGVPSALSGPPQQSQSQAGLEPRTPQPADPPVTPADGPQFLPSGDPTYSVAAGPQSLPSGDPTYSVAAGPHASRSPAMPARPPLSDEARRNIRQTLAQVERELERLTKTIEAAPSGRACSGAGADPHRTASAIRALLATYESLAQAERGLRLLRGLLLQLFWNHGLHHTLGAATLSQFAEAHLGLSERSARALVSEARLFRDEPLLAQAFRAGRIGTVQAGFLRHVALSRTLPAHLRRAERVTVRQLEKETRFLERLADLAPTLWRRHPGPLPDPRLETDLLEALAHRGVNPETAAQELETRGLGSVPSSRPAGLSSHFAEDPAVNPVILARLDALLDLYALAVSSDGGDSEPGPASRNPGDRQTLASRRMTTITFHLPPDILGAWNAALHGLRAARGPLPTWACMVLLVRDALDEWLREDPDRRPTEHAILERDDYACRAPGCSSRSNLEVHHIRFRSQGGTDHAWNKVTLCHAHHHHAVHAGTVRLQGTAPGDLRWEMGTRIDRGSILVTRGDRILRRARG